MSYSNQKQHRSRAVRRAHKYATQVTRESLREWARTSGHPLAAEWLTDKCTPPRKKIRAPKQTTATSKK